MQPKGYDILGLAQRAGQVHSGDAAAEAVIKKGRAKLVMLARDASAKTKEHFINLAKYHKAPWIECGEMLQFGISLGKSPRSVVVIAEDNFAKRLQQLFIGEEEDF